MSVEELDQQEQQQQRKPLSLLASEMFGGDFKGEAKTPESEDQPEPPETDETNEVIPEDADEDSHPVAEAESEIPDDDDQSEEALIGKALQEEGAQEVAPETLNSIDDVARRLDLDSESLYQLRIPVRDGAEITLGQLKDAYHDVVGASKQYQTIAQRYEESLGRIDALQTEAETAIMARFDHIDWDNLRSDDPALYAAEKTDFEDAKRRIDEMKRAKAELREDADKHFATDEETLERQRQALAEQSEMLVRKMPELADPMRKQEIGNAVINHMRTEGYTDHEIAAVLSSDHRAWVVVNKARLYDEARAKVQSAKKKLAKVPKALTPGTPKPQQQRNQERVAKARAAHRNAGTVDSGLALLKAKRGD